MMTLEFGINWQIRPIIGIAGTFDRGGRPLWKRYVEGDVSGVAVSAGAEVVVAGTRQGHMYLWDGQGEPLYHAVASEIIRDVAVASDGQTAVAVSKDEHVYGFLLPPRPRPSLSPAAGEGTGAPDPTLAPLRRLLIQRLNLQETRACCFDLGVDFENLGGEGKAGKLRALLAHLTQREALQRLIDWLHQNRPDMDAALDEILEE